MNRVVLHLDMDAFYAAIEVRENPTLAGLPLIVGHRGRRGVVATCSYEAREFGVRSAMPSVVAERKCPQAVWLPGRMELYVEVSGRIRCLLERRSPRVEPLSIDEAFIDLTGIVPDLAGGALVARELKAEIRAQERLSASVGVAPNKFLAKVASDLEKPDGLVLLPHEALVARLWPLPVMRLWGVGPVLGQRLVQAGLREVGDVLRIPEEDLVRLVGEALAGHLRALARGEDDRPVEPHRQAKSISAERTYAVDLVDPQEIDRALLARAEEVARALRREGLLGRTVHLKVRDPSYRTWTRASTLPEATDGVGPIVETARRLLRERIELGGRGIRLLGVGISGLRPPGGGQATALFVDAREERLRRVERAADVARERLGPEAVTRARLITRPGREPGPPEASSPPAVD